MRAIETLTYDLLADGEYQGRYDSLSELEAGKAEIDWTTDIQVECDTEWRIVDDNGNVQEWLATEREARAYLAD